MRCYLRPVVTPLSAPLPFPHHPAVRPNTPIHPTRAPARAHGIFTVSCSLTGRPRAPISWRWRGRCTACAHRPRSRRTPSPRSNDRGLSFGEVGGFRVVQLVGTSVAGVYAHMQAGCRRAGCGWRVWLFVGGQGPMQGQWELTHRGMWHGCGTGLSSRRGT